LFYPEDVWDIAVRMLAAIACGAVLGWEREAQNKPAGVRTHMMVALGAAAFTLITLKIFEAAQADPNHTISADPLRVVSGVIGGIGFLGAGTIIQSHRSVQGITTAAGIWVVGSVGIACGIGYYTVAVLTVFLGVVVLLGVGVAERLVSRKLSGGKSPDPELNKNESAEPEDEENNLLKKADHMQRSSSPGE
jgi:putative Mg2+ transporter-C (MgtC) family protein